MQSAASEDREGYAPGDAAVSAGTSGRLSARPLGDSPRTHTAASLSPGSSSPSRRGRPHIGFPVRWLDSINITDVFPRTRCASAARQFVHSSRSVGIAAKATAGSLGTAGWAIRGSHFPVHANAAPRAQAHVRDFARRDQYHPGDGNSAQPFRHNSVELRSAKGGDSNGGGWRGEKHGPLVGGVCSTLVFSAS